MGQISTNVLKKAFATGRHAFRSPSIAFYDIFALACAEIKIWRFFDEKVTYVFRLLCFLNFFLPFLFLVFLYFCCSDCPSTGLYFQLKNLRENIIETGNFYHGVGKCGFHSNFGAFLCMFQTPDLGIIGKIFSSCGT